MSETPESEAPPKRRRPSDDLAELGGQLVWALKQLERDPTGEDADLYRAYLHKALAIAWRRVAEGDFSAPRQTLDMLRNTRPFVSRHMTSTAGPCARAAAEVAAVVDGLYVADESLDLHRSMARLENRALARHERAILAVLQNQERYLRRGEIHAELPEKDRPSVSRVGQLLLELYHDNLLVRILKPTQGHSDAGFYALSPRGAQVCQQVLGQPAPAESSEPHPEMALSDLHKQLFEIVADTAVPPSQRSIAAGLLANATAATEATHKAITALERTESGSQSKPLLAAIKTTLRYQLERLAVVVGGSISSAAPTP